MAFDKTQAEAVASQHSTQVATQAVAGAKTAKLLIDAKAVQVGVKGSADISKMDADVTFQDASGCGRSPLGNVKLSNKRIHVSRIKDEQNLCPKNLDNTYFAELIAKGQSPEGETLDASFVKSIMDYRATKIAAEVEKLIWQGDTAGAGNLNKIDGLLKQINGASDKIVIAESGADVIAKLKSVYFAMPVAVRKSEDFRLFIGEDMYEQYLSTLAEKNIFQTVDSNTLYGTTAKFEVVPGLNETNKVVAAKISDLHLGLDGTDDADKVDFRYSPETKQFYMDFHFAVGVAAVYTNQIGIADFAA